MFNIKEKKVLITGASGGIGRALFELFSERGAIVAVQGTNQAKLEKLIKNYAHNSKIFPADLSDKHSVKSFAAKVEEEMGVRVTIG